VSILVLCECGQHFETAEAHAGRRALCPVCGRELIIPMPEILVIRDEPVLLSHKAVASLALGVLFFFSCLSNIPAIVLGHSALRDINGSGGRLRGRGMATAGIVLGWTGCLFTLIALSFSAYNHAREDGRRAWCANNLKQFGLAMNNYHQSNECLPPAAITDRNGKPLLSWRVAILPYFDSSDLYYKFHLDEPWDSPHNLTLLNAMPSYFKCPSDPDPKPGMTNYVAVIGPSTCFRPDFQPVRFADITDGTSDTLLLGESRRAVPWTKPEDLPFDLKIPFSGLGSAHNSGFNALLADGFVKFLKNTISPAVFNALLTRNGGEILSGERY
jgi:Protein of unknown function (DUF1559)/Domain of unknown function (DUF4190)